MEELLNSISTYGYIILFFYSFGGGFFGLVAAGVLSFSGKMDIGTSILIASTSNFLGDIALFYFARNYKGEVHTYIKKHRRKLAYSHVLMKKYGSKIILFQKFLYGVKTLVPIAIGLTKYDFKTFAIYNLFSSIIWGLTFGLVSYYSSEYILEGFSFLYENSYIMPMIALTLIAIIWKYLSKR